ncbi:hypothetical protein J0A67_07600 [Algoriphagus aestuariicola]|jgi:hypothetical protein|uniref:Uncharacterized protein n=1 Tax=Algoriphagus aestuariicola TaxID=1852016 RepID=A0ABS3BNU2_9BACT|nr:hypothetical protein [Algoriphagus aestuariicola]MBN7800720.1 hypothetical protein [Algoriphagus aestuariicola]
MKKLEVIELHHEFFEDFEFQFHSTHLLFYKPFPQGQQVIFVHYTENSDQAYLEYSFGVRIDAVEKIIHRFLPTLKGYSERSITLIQTPDGISGNIPNRFDVKSDSILADAIGAAEKFFVSEGFPWMDKMIDPKNLENEFALQKDQGFKTHNFVYNSFRGATLAKLYNAADYPILRAFYLEQIKQREMTPFTIASFLQLLNYLDHLEV